MKLEVQDGVALLRMAEGKGNAIGARWLEEMELALDELLASGARAMVVVALHGTCLGGRNAGPWMDGLMQFVQVDAGGRPEPLEVEPPAEASPLGEPWGTLNERAGRLLAIRR